MNPALILFAIEAGVKLGRKVNEVLIDQTSERPLLLPLGDLFGSVPEAEASQFFLRPENVHLIKKGGPYFGFDPAEQLAAYKTLLAIEQSVSVGVTREEIVRQLADFEQYRKGFGAKHPVRRILGTAIEIGIDYFAANPEALGKDSTARRLVHSFVSSLTETDFAEGSRTEVVGDLLSAALRTLGQNASLVDDDPRLQVLLGGVTSALAEDIGLLKTQAGQITREKFFRRIGSSLLRGGAAAFTENIDLFVTGNDTARGLVKSTLTQVLTGLEGHEDLFTNESLEILFKSSLRAVAETPEVFSDNAVLQELIRRTVAVVTDQQWAKLFSEQTAAALLRETLEVASENMETLIDPKKPQEQLLASALSAMAASLATTIAGSGRVQDLLSQRQVVALAQAVFVEVSKHPEQLMGDDLSDPKKTVLAQVIGSVARALGDDPRRFVTGAGFIELVRAALEVVVRNADKLIDLSKPSPKSNLLFQILQELVTAVSETEDPRKLVSRDTFLEIAKRILPIVSSNLDAFLISQTPLVQGTIQTALELAGGTLSNSINGANLPILIDRLLRLVLQEELSLAEATAVEVAARRILKAA